MNEPRLRFNEFNDDWMKCRLSNFSNKVNKKNKNNEYNDVLTNSAKFGVIDQNNFFKKNIANNETTNGYFIINKNDYVYNPRISKEAKFGPIMRNKLDKTGIVSPLYYVFTVNDIYLSFLDNFFLSSKWHRFIYSNGNTGARSDRVSIRSNDFFNMKINLPNNNEQQKVGSFFEKLDKLIQLQSDKLEHLKLTKKGYLQKMFPTNENIDLRFKEFNETWNRNTLSNYANVYNGITHTATYVKSGIPFISAENVKNLKTNKYISKEDFQEEYKTNKPKKNDIVMVNQGKIGVANILVDENIAYYFGVALIHLNSKNIIPEFLLYTIQNQNFKKQLWDRTLHVAFPPKINKTEIPKILVNIPNLEEQTSIVSFIKKLDYMLKLNEQKLDNLKQQKKAYLQKMFI